MKLLINEKDLKIKRSIFTELSLAQKIQVLGVMREDAQPNYLKVKTFQRNADYSFLLKIAGLELDEFYRSLHPIHHFFLA